MNKPQILLDTNVWRAIADANAGQQVSSTAQRHDVAIVVAPSVVYETLALKNVELRNRVLRILASPRWMRLMPEAFSECAEIRAEVQRVHPEWLAPCPDLSEYKLHVRDWTRGMTSSKSWVGLGFWGRVREQPDRMADAVQTPRLAAARDQSKDAQVKGRARTVERLPLNDLVARLPEQPLGSEVEAWRWPAFAAFESHLHAVNGSYKNWLVPWFRTDPRDMGSDPWELFWIYECKTLSVPRQWLRWAFSYCQTFVKWTPGTPGDEQLASYLVDCDHVVSADKAFVRLVNEIGQQAPFALPKAYQLRGGVDGAADLIELLSKLDLESQPTRVSPGILSVTNTIQAGGDASCSESPLL